MKIVLTGGGSGGHFYPLIAVAESINQIADEEKLVDLELFYLADTPYSPRMLFENHITFKKINAGKRRLYRSFKNVLDIGKVGIGLIRALWVLYRLYPDVVFSKGGYPAFPVLFASRLLRIPLIIHETDIVPGRVTAYGAKFANHIAISWEESAPYFNTAITAHTGNPIRKNLLKPLVDGAHAFLELEHDVPIILVTGGSQGAQALNDVILDALPGLLNSYQIIHQTGPEGIEDATQRATYQLKDHPHASRYKLFAHLDETAQRMVAGVATLVISRPGGSIFEIAAWGLPSILIPIDKSNGDHQRRNAYAYARTGAAVVIEEENATATIVTTEIARILQSEELRGRMSAAASAFAKPDAAERIARDILRVALQHE
ncbi:MAG: UDP-N-acetylglucosamine--N-acetylmuramyl-(pentapeptide) pyrophosphoryl-undecaprenol N-acetylglucosamine transferase [bacterium]|nr:UDP-N-acetylglucosamine--N-acetylmuramyl-(pentapeptide) pyrophosphoryl-undecaprenol N-acetylglucosamine transferase [bacterium]